MSTTESYVVTLTPDAQRDLDGARRRAGALVRHLRTLQGDPQRGHVLAGSAHSRSLELSVHNRAYRAAYVVRPEQRRCVVFAIGPHDRFYPLAQQRCAALQREHLPAS